MRSTSLLLACSVSLFPFAASRADALRDDAGLDPAAFKRMSLEELSQIEVTSPSKEPTSAFRSAVAIFVITGDDIRRSGVTTIPGALRMAPGVEVARIDGSKWSVGIRGFGTRLSRSVLVLIDGRTVYTPLVAGTYWEVQDTLLEDIDRIEVIRGPGGTIWGPNAVNGVINIITKSTKDTRGTFASVGGGNEEQGFYNFRYGGANSKGLTYRLYGKGFTRGPEVHSDGKNFDDWRGVQGGFRTDWARGERDQFTIQGDLYKQDNGQRVGLSTYTPPANLDIIDNADLSGSNALFRWKRTFDENNDFQVQTYFDGTHRFEPNIGEDRNTFDIDFLARMKMPARQELLYGLEARVNLAHFHEVGSGLVFDPARRTDYLVSGFLQDDLNLIDRKLVLTLGSKIFRTNFTGVELEPSVRLLWTPSVKYTFWGSYTHALRTPSDAEENFYLSSVIGKDAAGRPFFARFGPNPDFAAEQLNGYEFGYRQLFGRKIYLDLASFYNHYHDLFSEDVAGATFTETALPFPETTPATHSLLPAQFRNDFDGRTTGFEIAPEWRPVNAWRLRASYSFLDMHLQSGAVAIRVQAPRTVEHFSPKHETGFDSSLDLAKRLQWNATWRYVSAITSASAPAYSAVDTRLAWHFSNHVELSVTGRNLLQPRHIEYADDPGGPVAIRRSAYLSLAWR